MDILDRLAIALVANLLYKDSDYFIFRSLSPKRDKSIDKTQSIRASLKANFWSEKVVWVTTNFAYMSRSSIYSHNQKATNKYKWPNYHKLGYFEQDYKLFHPWLFKNKSTTRNTKPQQLSLRSSYFIATTNKKNSNPEPFRLCVAQMIVEQQIAKTRATWCLDFSLSY